MAGMVTSLRDAHGRAIDTLPTSVRQALMVADGLMRMHGMQFEIVCEDCHERYPDNPNAWTVTATHGADGALDGLICNCKRRKFVSAF